MWIGERERAWEARCVGRGGPCGHRCIETMWVMEVIIVSIYEGTTKATEFSCGVLESWCWGIHARGSITNPNHKGYLVFEKTLEKRGTSQLEDLSSRVAQNRGLHQDVLWGRHWEGRFLGVNPQGHHPVFTCDPTFDQADYWIHNPSSGLSSTHAFFHSVLGGHHFLLEYYHACVHEETTYTVSTMYQ